MTSKPEDRKVNGLRRFLWLLPGRSDSALDQRPRRESIAGEPLDDDSAEYVFVARR